MIRQVTFGFLISMMSSCLFSCGLSTCFVRMSINESIHLTSPRVRNFALQKSFFAKKRIKFGVSATKMHSRTGSKFSNPWSFKFLVKNEPGSRNMVHFVQVLYNAPQGRSSFRTFWVTVRTGSRNEYGQFCAFAVEISPETVQNVVQLLPKFSCPIRNSHQQLKSADWSQQLETEYFQVEVDSFPRSRRSRWISDPGSAAMCGHWAPWQPYNAGRCRQRQTDGRRPCQQLDVIECQSTVRTRTHCNPMSTLNDVFRATIVAKLTCRSGMLRTLLFADRWRLDFCGGDLYRLLNCYLTRGRCIFNRILCNDHHVL